MLFENEQTHLKYKNEEEFQVITVSSSKEKADAALLLKHEVKLLGKTALPAEKIMIKVHLTRRT